MDAINFDNICHVRHSCSSS